MDIYPDMPHVIIAGEPGKSELFPDVTSAYNNFASGNVCHARPDAEKCLYWTYRASENKGMGYESMPRPRKMDILGIG